jgi:predicted MarR family transcription regulator
VSDRREQHRAALAEIGTAAAALRSAQHALVARARPAALAALADGMTVEEVAAAVGFSTAAIEKWHAKARTTAARPLLATGTDAKVLHVLHRAGRPVRQRDIVHAAQLRSGTVSKAVRRLVATGRAIRNDDGTLSPVATKR